MRRIASSLGLMLCFVSGTAFADHPEIVSAKGHKYVVWLNPTDPDDSSVPPLTAENVTYYCASAEGFAQRMWQLTNGRHYVWQVEYVYSQQPPMRYDVEWTRDDGIAMGPSVVQMNDALLQATHTWSEGSDPDGVTTTPNTRKQCLGGVCVHATCPVGFSIQSSSFSPNRERCVDSAGKSMLEPVAQSAFVFAHEVSHSKYALTDEYYLNDTDPVLYGFRVCSNPFEWHTSLMGTRDADLWCDANTHLDARYINSPFSGTKLVTYAPVVSNGNQWTRAKGQWMDLMGYDPGPAFTKGPGVVPQNESFTKPVAPWTALPTDPICLFTGDMFPNQIVNDVMVVVDKSGSMNYRATPLDLTAYEHAFSAGLAHFNRTPSGRKSGLSVFDSANQRAIPYSTFAGARALSEFPYAASGTTDLCEAISDAALQVRQSGTSDASGHMLLLTDGRPTVSDCSTAAQVRDAAMRACMPTDGGKKVAISVLAFGDADYTLLDQISQMCGGDLRTVDAAPAPPAPPAIPAIPAGSPTPLNIQAAASRLAYRVRSFHDAMFAIEPKPAVFERKFDLPAGTSTAEFVWMAERTQNIVVPSVPQPTVAFALASSGTCAFANYGFELIDPNGNPAGTDVVDPATELGYMTRTRKVDNPMPGRWTMRMNGGAPCVVGGSEPAPEAAMFSVYRNTRVRPLVQLSKTVAAANEPIKVTASLRIDQHSVESNISVNAKLVNGSTQVSVPMYDDGVSGGDELAGDGVYTATINPTCASGNLAPGGYRFVVEFSSDANTAIPVIIRDTDVLAAVGPNATTNASPVTATLVEEKSLAIRSCNLSPTACGGASSSNLCAEPTTTVLGGPITIAPGTTVPDISVAISDCPIGTQGVTVGVGPGITTSNVRSTYDDAAGFGTVTFNMTAAPTAPTGQNQIAIAMGRVICGTAGATITTCNPVPATLPPLTVAVCGSGGAQNVTVSKPALAGSCALSPTITGRVLTSNGTTLNPPLPIPSNGVISLAPGTHVIEWTVTSGAVTRTTRQTVFIVSGISAGGSFILADRARVMKNATEFNSITNTGNGQTELGVTAHSGDITSVGNVFLRSSANVHGSIRTSGSLTRQTQTVVSGAIQQHVALSLGGITNPPISFPAMLPASDVVIAPDTNGSASLGAHRRLTVNSRATLTLAAGDYLIEELDVEPQAKVVVAPSTRLFVRNSVIYRGQFVNAANQPASTFLAYYGQNSIFMESNFSGTLLAGAARAVLGDGDSHTYGGRLLAKEIELRPDTIFTCSGAGTVFDATSGPPRTTLNESFEREFEGINVELSDQTPSAGCSLEQGRSAHGWLIVFGGLVTAGLLRSRRRTRT